MKFTMAHNNINVLDLEKNLAFYKKALGMEQINKHEAPDGSFLIVFLGDGQSQHKLELT